MCGADTGDSKPAIRSEPGRGSASTLEAPGKTVPDGLGRTATGRRFWTTLLAGAARALSPGRLRTCIGALLLAASLGFLGYGVSAGWRQLAQQDWQVSVRGVVVSISLFSLDFALLVIAWNSLMKSLARSARWRENVEVYCYSEVLKRLPTAIWFILGRIALYRDKGISGFTSSMATALELALVITSGAILHTICVVLSRHSANPASLVLVLIAAIGTAVVYLGASRIPRLLPGLFGQEVPSLAPTPRRTYISGWLLLYGASWLVGGAAFHVFVSSMDATAQLHVLDSVAVWTASGVLGTVSLLAPTSFGIQEAILSILLGPYMPLSVAIAVCLLFRVITSVVQVTWSLGALALCRWARPSLVRRSS